MSIILEYRKVTEEIAVAESKLTRARREIWRQCGSKGGGGTTVDYARLPVQTSGYSPGDLEAGFQAWLDYQQLLEDIEGLYRQLEALRETINKLGDTRKRIIMMRIDGYTQRQIATELGYSKRWIEINLSKAEKEFGISSVGRDEIL